MRCTAHEGIAKSNLQACDIETAGINEEHKVDKIFNTRVWTSLALERVCVELLREVFFSRDRRE